MIKKKIGIEILLWILFLLTCASVGYLQGLDPDVQIFDHFSNPTPIRIVTLADYFFPEKIISQLEKKTHSKIQIVSIKSWDDLNVELIANNSPDILFIPSHWAHTLHQQVLLSNEFYFKFLSAEFLSNDFNLSQNPIEKDFIPLYWAQLGLYSTNEKNKTADFLNDTDLFVGFCQDLKRNPKQYTEFMKLKFSVHTLQELLQKTDAPETDVFLRTNISQLTHPDWKLVTGYSPFIYILGFALSKNGINQTKSTEVINTYMSLDIQQPLLEALPFASTLNSINRLATGVREKRASYIRDLVMKNTLFIKNKEKSSDQKAIELSDAFRTKASGL